MLDRTGPTARRFPLVARPRPPCTPLAARVAHLSTLADTADRDTDQAAASAVFNQAALLASDVGLPDLARTWCHRHATAYLRALPLGAQAARYALEPLVNLARLHIRDGNGDTAFRLLDDLYTAVTARTDTVIDGIPVPLGTLTATDDDHHLLRQWLWTVHLADGTRALTCVGRWQNAHNHLLRHRGVGRRMLDGRQVAVLARTVDGDPGGALALLRDTALGEPWEAAVTACLTVLCRRIAMHPVEGDTAAALDHYRRFAPASGLAVFHTRLGLSVIDAIGDAQSTAYHIAADLIRRTTASRDGYAARDLLSHDACQSVVTDQQTRDLTEIVEACALGCRVIPAVLRSALSTALDTSEAVLARAKACPRTLPSSASPQP